MPGKILYMKIVSCLWSEIYKLLTDILLATYHQGIIKITCTAFSKLPVGVKLYLKNL